MDMWMDVDTALAEVPVNLLPLIDDTDFKTRETAVAYNAAGMDLVWNFVTTGGALTQTAVTPTTAGTYDWTHQGDGIYTIEIPASGGASINNDTEGFGWFSGVATGVLPWRGPVIGFRAAALNDALIDSAWSTTRGLAGTALPNAAADAAGGLVISDAGGLDADAQRSDVAAILVDTGTTLDGRIPAALVSGRIDASVGAMASGVLTATAIAADAIGASELAADAVAEIADAVWDEVLSGHLTSGTTGAGLNAAGSAGDPWATTVPGAYGAGTAGKILGDNLDAAVSSRASQASVDTIDGNVDAILVDTGTTLQAELDGIQADTEDIQSRIPAALTGAGNLKADAQVVSDKTGYALTSAYDAAKTAATQTSVDDLPTNAELATALGTADDAVLAAIAALNNLSSAGAQSAVAAALTAYAAAKTSDVPTAAVVADAVWDEARAGHVGAGSFGEGVILTSAYDAAKTAATQASVNTIDDFLDTEVAGILAAVDTEVGAIKTTTDQLTFTTANKVDARAFTVDDKTGYSIASGGIGSGAHAAAELNALADAFLDRNMATGTDSGANNTTTRTVRQALRRLRNKEAIAAGTLSTYKEDDTTVSWTAAVTTTAGDPLSAVDPT